MFIDALLLYAWCRLPALQGLKGGGTISADIKCFPKSTVWFFLTAFKLLRFFSPACAQLSLFANLPANLVSGCLSGSVDRGKPPNNLAGPLPLACLKNLVGGGDRWSQ